MNHRWKKVEDPMFRVKGSVCDGGVATPAVVGNMSLICRYHSGMEKVYKDEIAELEAKLAIAVDVLSRIRQWDHLDGAGDGEFWKGQIDEALAKIQEKP